MGILQSGNLVWYHPFDTTVDGAGTDWSYTASSWPAATTSIAGKVGNGRGIAAPSQASISDGGDGGYANWTGATRMTAAFWADLDGNGVAAGMFTSNTNTHLIQVLANGTMILYPGNVSQSVATGAGAVATAAGWHFYILDAERTGSNWVFRHSVDGAAWTQESSLTGVTFAGTPAEATVVVNYDSEFDDMAVWRDADLFTATELQNLYDLGNTFGEGMDKYDENYGSPICWQATAEMPDGTVWRDSGCGPCPAVIRVPRGAADIVVTDEGKRIQPRIVEG